MGMDGIQLNAINPLKRPDLGSCAIITLEFDSAIRLCGRQNFQTRCLSWAN